MENIMMVVFLGSIALLIGGVFYQKAFFVTHNTCSKPKALLVMLLGLSWISTILTAIVPIITLPFSKGFMDILEVIAFFLVALAFLVLETWGLKKIRNNLKEDYPDERAVLAKELFAGFGLLISGLFYITFFWVFIFTRRR